jgi:hypothetical protein
MERMPTHMGTETGVGGCAGPYWAAYNTDIMLYTLCRRRAWKVCTRKRSQIWNHLAWGLEVIFIVTQTVRFVVQSSAL